MRQKRASYNKTLKETADINLDCTQLTFPGLYDYIPVYHIELVCDRQVKFENRRSIHNSDDVVALFKDELLRSDREKLLSILLNTKNMVIGIEVVSIGTLNTSVVHPRLCAAAHSVVMLPGKLCCDSWIRSDLAWRLL